MPTHSAVVQLPDQITLCEPVFGKLNMQGHSVAREPRSCPTGLSRADIC